MSLTDRVALVTGGGSGIGRATALRLAAEGARLALLGRTAGQLEEVADLVRAAGGEAVTLLADVAVPEQVEEAYARLAATWDRLDIVVANAGINGAWAPVWELTPEEWDQTLGINLRGTFLAIKYAVPYMRERGGAMVVISSVNGTRTFFNTGSTAYSASKAGQVAVAKICALELARFHIRVNVVCPGWIKTEIGENTWMRNMSEIRGLYHPEPSHTVPLTNNKPGSAEQVADVVAFLVSDAASHVTGTEMWVDGGGSLF